MLTNKALFTTERNLELPLTLNALAQPAACRHFIWRTLLARPPASP
jgi:hypothetical protein